MFFQGFCDWLATFQRYLRSYEYLKTIYWIFRQKNWKKQSSWVTNKKYLKWNKQSGQYES